MLSPLQKSYNWLCLHSQGIPQSVFPSTGKVICSKHRSNYASWHFQGVLVISFCNQEEKKKVPTHLFKLISKQLPLWGPYYFAEPTTVSLLMFYLLPGQLSLRRVGTVVQWGSPLSALECQFTLWLLYLHSSPLLMYFRRQKMAKHLGLCCPVRDQTGDQPGPALFKCG